jgi:hypothetical protein
MESDKKVELIPDDSPFCLNETPAIRERIQRDLRTVIAAVLEAVTPVRPVTAIALAGGFGRGEGGVILRNGRPAPVNDYDITLTIPPASVFVKRRVRKVLADLSQRLEKELGIAVDLDARDPKDLARAPNIILWYEIQAGNKILWGDANAFKPMPPLDPAKIPLWDGTLLLFNRASGLLLAKRMLLEKDFGDVEKKTHFVIQLSKAALALGDCLLIREKRYCASYTERMLRAHEVNLADVPNGREIIRQYKEMLELKVRPDFSPYLDRNFKPWFEECAARHNAFFKWWEEKRLGRSFATWHEYAASVPVKFAVSGNRLKIFASNFARFGTPTSIKEFRRYMLPLRERLIDAMPLLLFEPTAANLARAAKILRIAPEAADETALQAQLIKRYSSLWH